MQRQLNPQTTSISSVPQYSLVGVREVSEMLGVSERQVRRLVAVCAMPAPLKLRGLRKWRASEIHAWIEGGCVPQRSNKTINHH